MEVYFDNAATSRVSEETARKMFDIVTKTYGNPSSLHNKGFKAEKEVENSRQIIASALKVQKKDIYFTSGGTEGNNIIVYGVLNAYKRKGKHILISSIEHPSIKETVYFYEELGYEIEEIPVNNKGYINQEKLFEMIRKDTILVSIIHVNNEIGTIQEIESIAKGIKLKNETALFHIDAVQSFGKYRLIPSRIGVDLLTLSAHKIHGPKGVGAIYVAPNVRLTPLVHGGNQQKGVRPGTENVSGIVGLGSATQVAYEQLSDIKAHISGIRAYMVEQLKEHITDIEFNSDIEHGAYHILNIRIKNVKSEVILHTLEELNIYVSSGSACSSNKRQHRFVLQAIGKTVEEADQAIRFSFSKYNTLEEVDFCINKLKECLPVLRRFIRK